jgi:ATP synthase protein I
MAGRRRPESQPQQSQPPQPRAPQPRAPQPRGSGPADGPPVGGSEAGWALFSYLISGMAFYGFIGWLIGRWTHVALLFPLGMLVGLGLAIVLIVYKYGRS